LSSAKLFIFPSLYEGFGLPVLESMAAGTPVITSNNSSLPEVAGTAGVLINPLDQPQINLAVEKILTDQNFAHNLITEGKLQASKFSWEVAAKATLNVLSNGGT
ncbi:glycosyltransferase, partial [Patescibacteria group bacterium]|nr:glycosyltransferase [Patescibacteria group bacterium]